MAGNNKTSGITRAEKKQQTRQKLIEATMEVIASEGFSGVTMAKVAEKANLSRGIGNFHFQSKEQLLLETLRTLYTEFDEGWRNAVADAGSSPYDQISAVIVTTLTPDRNANFSANDGNQADHFANGIKKQIGVCRIMHIGFNYKRITTAP